MDNEWPRAALVDVRATPSGDAPQVLQGLRNEAQRPVKTLRLGCILGLLRVATGRRDAGGDLERARATCKLLAETHEYLSHRAASLGSEAIGAEGVGSQYRARVVRRRLRGREGPVLEWENGRRQDSVS